MKKLSLVAILISLIMGVTAYLASTNIFVAAIVVVLFITYYFILAYKKLKKYFQKKDRISYCHQFINSFVITMSVTDSLSESYQSGIQGCEGEFKDVTNEIANLSDNEKITYLRKYFNLGIYKMFLNVIDIYLEQGGNILDMSDSLISESTRIEDSLNQSVKSTRKNIFEFVILWGMSIGVLLFMRFGVSSFYLVMIKSPIFLGLILVYYLLVLGSIHLAIVRSTSLFIKEDKV